MNSQLKHTKAYLAAAILTAATFGLGGCGGKHHEKTNDDAGDAFLGKDEVSNVNRLSDLQIAGGSRTDSTLRAYHFHRGSLNSLGRQKLDRMVAANEAEAMDAGGDDGEAMTVYLDASSGAAATEEVAKRLSDARHDAVTDYLMGRGLTEDMFRIELGHNPDNTFLASSAAGSAATEAGDAAPAGGAPAAGGPPAGGTTK
jgi:hypothetical protein